MKRPDVQQSVAIFEGGLVVAAIAMAIVHQMAWACFLVLLAIWIGVGS